MPGQCGDVATALAQRRDSQLDDVQAVVEVLAKASGLYLVFQVLVGGTKNPHVDGFFLLAAYRAHGFFLQGSQQFYLHGQGQVGDLIKKQGAAVGGQK